MKGNEGNDVIEDLEDLLHTCHILLPYPDASAYALHLTIWGWFSPLIKGHFGLCWKATMDVGKCLEILEKEDLKE